MNMTNFNNVLSEIINKQKKRELRQQIQKALKAKRSEAALRAAQTRRNRKEGRMNTGPQEPSRKSTRTIIKPIVFKPACKVTVKGKGKGVGKGKGIGKGKGVGKVKGVGKGKKSNETRCSAQAGPSVLNFGSAQAGPSVPSRFTFNFGSLEKSLTAENNFIKRKKQIIGMLKSSDKRGLSPKQLKAIASFPFLNRNRYYNGIKLTDNEKNEMITTHAKTYLNLQRQYNVNKALRAGVSCDMQM